MGTFIVAGVFLFLFVLAVIKIARDRKSSACSGSGQCGQCGQCGRKHQTIKVVAEDKSIDLMCSPDLTLPS